MSPVVTFRYYIPNRRIVCMHVSQTRYIFSNILRGDCVLPESRCVYIRWVDVICPQCHNTGVQQTVTIRPIYIVYDLAIFVRHFLNHGTHAFKTI